MPKPYLVICDPDPAQDYADFRRLMAGWGGVQLTPASWLAIFNRDPSDIREMVRRTLRSTDTIVVIELKRGSQWATANVAEAVNASLAANISPSELSP